MLELNFKKIKNSKIYCLKFSTDLGSIDSIISKNLEFLLYLSSNKLISKSEKDLNILVKTLGNFSNYDSFEIYSFFEKLSLKTNYLISYDLIGVGKYVHLKSKK